MEQVLEVAHERRATKTRCGRGINGWHTPLYVLNVAGCKVTHHSALKKLTNYLHISPCEGHSRRHLTLNVAEVAFAVGYTSVLA